jgi:hypothetical protein
MTEYTIDGKIYRAGALAALAGGEKITLRKDETGQVTGFDGDLDAVMIPLAEAITSLKDEDVEYIINACLEVTERKQAGGGWARLRSGGATMYSDLSLPVMLQITYYVIKDNLLGFFGALPSDSPLGALTRQAFHG